MLPQDEAMRLASNKEIPDHLRGIDLCLLASVYEFTGVESYAFKCYEKAYNNYSSEMRAKDHLNYGNCLMMCEQHLYDKAIEQYQKAISKDTNYMKAYFSMGLCYLNKRDVNKAKINFKKAKSLDQYTFSQLAQQMGIQPDLYY